MIDLTLFTDLNVFVSSLQPITLSWWPLFRDAVFYILSIVVLILVRNPPVNKQAAGRELILRVWQGINLVLAESLEQRNQFALHQTISERLE